MSYINKFLDFDQDIFFKKCLELMERGTIVNTVRKLLQAPRLKSLTSPLLLE